MSKALLVILLSSLFIITIWFKDGYIMGTAEDGLIFYDVSHYLPEAQYAWMEHPGLGRASLTLTAAKPTYLVLNFLQNLGVPSFLIQAGVFWLLLAGAGIGMYLLTKEFFPKLPFKFTMLASFFYLFNPIVTANIWTRFLLNYIFFYAMLPLVTFIFIKGLTSQKYIWAFVLAPVLLIYSFALTYIAFSLLLWIIFVLFTVIFMIVSKEKKARLFFLKYFLLTFFIYIFTNAWWLSQLPVLVMDFSSSIYSFGTEVNVGILDALSQKMGNLVDIFRLINIWYFTTNTFFWVKFFNTPLMIFFEFMVVAVLLYPLVKAKIKKESIILGSLLLISLFLIKGSNPPFGEVYKLIFENVSFLQILRNPFEKFGFLLLLISAPLFSVGLFTLLSDLPKKFHFWIYTFFLLLIVLVFGFPVYTGFALMSLDPPTNDYSVGYKVKVPDYYRQTDGWLNKQEGNFRYLGFPIANEGITYIWEKGYAGVDLQSILFTKPGISHNTAVPYYYQLVSQIEPLLFSEGDFSRLADVLNVRYYLIRNDVDFNLRKIKNPADVESRLVDKEKKGEVKKVAQFGKLSFWENTRWRDTTFYRLTASKKRDSASSTASATLNLDDFPTNEQIQLLAYQRVNPTKYIVHIENNSSPVILVFSELFHQGWRAYYPDGTEVKHHQLVSSFANGWEIDRQGSFNVSVEFIPQKWMDIGEGVSIASYVLIALALGYITKRKVKGH